MASQGRGARSKGHGYERAVAKKMSEWWGGTFARTPGSGSLHWGSDNRVAGDIVAPPEVDFPFVTECKKHEGWTMDHVLLDIGDPSKWWGQVVTDARRVQRVPMLIFSRNRAKDYVMVPYDSWLYARLRSISNSHMKTRVSFKNIRGESQHFDVIVTVLEDISQIDPEALKDYAKELDWDPYKDQYE